MIDEVELSSKHKGDILEKNVEFLFNNAGFKTSRNIKISSYEIDVLAEIGNRRIIIECKNYQSSSITVRNIIHQWSSKNTIIKSHKVVIVISGIEIAERDRALAKELLITIWDDTDLSRLFVLSNKGEEKLRLKLLEDIDVQSLSIAEINHYDIVFELFKESFNWQKINSTVLKYSKLYKILKEHIITNLNLEGADVHKLKCHADLFEKIRYDEIREKGSHQYRPDYIWDKIKLQLKNDDGGLNNIDIESSELYINYMNELEEYWDGLRELFMSDSIQDLSSKIYARLELFKVDYETFMLHFGIDNFQRSVKIYGEEGFYFLEVVSISDKDADTLDWIFAGEHLKKKLLENAGPNRFVWFFSSTDDLRDRICRLVIDFWGFSDVVNVIDREILTRIESFEKRR